MVLGGIKVLIKMEAREKIMLSKPWFVSYVTHINSILVRLLVFLFP